MRTESKKPRLCLALPGINYLADTGSAASNLPLVPYLAQDFDVTLVFRRVLETHRLNYSCLTILDDTHFSKERHAAINYFMPKGIFDLRRYASVLDGFAQDHAGDFDFVIEKQWSLVGLFSTLFTRRGVPSAFVMEGEYYTASKVQPDWPRNPAGRITLEIFKHSLPHLRSRWIRNANTVIVETEQMKSFLVDNGYVSGKTPILIIGVGVDKDIFFPRDRAYCRQQLGIRNDTLVIAYVGDLHRFLKDPAPAIEALGIERPKGVVLHIVGDGIKQKELKEIAKQYRSSVIFHGKHEQKKAAVYMGAANLCIAPYDKEPFARGEFTSASLKVPEYLACGRPVVTIPCERMEHLLDRGKYGFFVENRVEAYRNFFRNLPTWSQMLVKENVLLEDLETSILESRRIVLSWRDIAEMYKKLILDNLERK